MFKQRLISGIILVLIAFVTLYYGGFLTFFVVGAHCIYGKCIVLFIITSWIGTVCNATGIISIDFAYCSVRFYFSKV